jgi:hypothetical protein
LEKILRNLVQSKQVASKLGTIRLVSNSCCFFVPAVLFFLKLFTLLLQFDEFCFGFVEFESQQSMQAAIEVCPFLRLSS